MEICDQNSHIPAPLRPFDCSANDVISFKLVRCEQDLDDDETEFAASFTHQIFGENERIFGYKNLRIDIFCLSSSLDFYLNVEYEEKLNSKKYQQIKADDIEATLRPWMPDETTSNLDKFIRKLSNQSSYLPFGEQISSYPMKSGNKTRHFSVYRYDKTIVDDDSFHNWYSRLETFLVFYIDAASPIDKTDPNWLIYLLYEEHCNQSTEKCFSPIGFVSVYLYYSYPEKKRARISQVLILPPHQRQGHGRRFIKTIYEDLINDGRIRDITAEDPSDEFVCLRDLVQFELVQQHLPEIFSKKSMGEHRQLTKETIDRARQICKLTKKETRRVHEISFLYSINQHDEEQFKSFRLLVKKRLFEPLQFDKRRRLQLADPSLEALATDPEKRKVYLESQFQLVVEHYRNLIKSFDKYSNSC